MERGCSDWGYDKKRFKNVSFNFIYADAGGDDQCRPNPLPPDKVVIDGNPVFERELDGSR